MAKNIKKTSYFVDKPFDFILFITVIILLALGLIMVLSASSPSALAENGNSYVYFEKQGIYAIIGVIAMMAISKVDYRFYKKFYKIAYIVSIILLILVVAPGLGVSSGGARRWLNLGVRFQPSEVAKIGLIIFYAAYLTDNSKNLKGLMNGFVKPFIIVVPVIAILLGIQNHLSASIIILLILSIMMIMAGTRFIYFSTLGIAGASIGAIGMYLIAKYTENGAFRLKRVTSFLNPWADKQGDGWQIIQSLYAIGSGGLFGVGLRRK